MKKSPRRPQALNCREQVLRSVQSLQSAGNLSLYDRGVQGQLEELADQLLDPPGKRGRKLAREYPWLSKRQLKARYAEESTRDPGIMDAYYSPTPYLARRKPVGDHPGRQYKVPICS